jgi:hypothetical protein
MAQAKETKSMEIVADGCCVASPHASWQVCAGLLSMQSSNVAVSSAWELSSAANSDSTALLARRRGTTFKKRG